MSSPPAPLPSLALVRHADAVVDRLGRFDLTDAELRAVRVTLARGNVPTLEADLHLGGGQDVEYCVTLRCTDVADLSLADFEHRNVITGWAVEPAGQVDADGRNVRVTLTGAPGCDLDLRCAGIEVVSVKPVPPDEI